ncbi:MAG TPA: DsbA family protein [Acidimicrobiales bacterium]|nr:DsbA family protein [Acidimicrobiales bacterium]
MSTLTRDVTDPTQAFGVTWDYRCPFARNVHEHLITGLRGGADWDVTFVPFSLGQVHVEEGQPDIWGRWRDDTGLLALQAGVVVRDKLPERFLDVHEALFALRHDHGGQLRDEAAVRGVLTEQGVDADMVLDEIEGGQPIEIVRDEHERAVARHQVWGVPTFILGGQAAFIRLMHRPRGDVAEATRSIERVLDLLSWSDLNELKHTSIPR